MKKKKNYPLYGGTPPHVAGDDTSRTAAEAAVESASRVREIVYAFLVAKGLEGATVDEVELALGKTHQSAGPRVRELVLLGRACFSGQLRPTRSKRPARVWITMDTATANGINPERPAPSLNRLVLDLLSARPASADFDLALGVLRQHVRGQRTG